jgi:hypothetical protein
MARFNEILVGRFNKALTKIFSIKGSAPAPQCSSEIAATIELEQVAIENRFLMSVDSYAVGLTQNGIAATISTIKFRNPVGSNVIAVFEKISAATSAADNIDVQEGTDQTNGGIVVSISTINNLDARSGRVSSLIMSTSAGAAPPSQVTLERVTVLTNVTYDFIVSQNQEIILSPGRCLQVLNTVPNLNLICSFKWRERLLEESERQ